MITNYEIREAARLNRVKLWRVAAELGCSDGSLSRKLRFELSKKDKEKIMEIIIKIAAEKEVI